MPVSALTKLITHYLALVIIFTAASKKDPPYHLDQFFHPPFTFFLLAKMHKPKNIFQFSKVNIPRHVADFSLEHRLIISHLTYGNSVPTKKGARILTKPKIGGENLGKNRCK